uniref:Uncharacterized protein n=1 Tax=Rhizophora mucronata TaxID=61149 RepID=A0A2P2Q0S4_RHIMU
MLLAFLPQNLVIPLLLLWLGLFLFEWSLFILFY